MTYQPPVPQILLAMKVAGRLGTAHYPHLTEEDASAIVHEAGRFAADRIAPLNTVGDKNPAKLVNGRVMTPPGWRETYQDWRAAGWNSLTGDSAHGGQELPMLMAVACTELWNAANISFALCPLLTMGAIEAISNHASPELKASYLPKMISGEWSGTMNLTEPQSGSDLSGLRCKAQRAGDGTYRITGQKIYITYGEHDLTSNIAHLVLARLEDAPEGTRGISLFLVPKIRPDGTANDLRCHSLEHKLGIHGSPTCTMIYGDNGGATGWLIGEENRGLACMFTMMNNARLAVGVQGVALADRAFQAALWFAAERKQGRAPGVTRGSSAIVAHPDVKRMLLDMRSKTAAARMLCMATASAIDEAKHAESPEARQHANARASLLTPLAKSYATDIAVEVSSSAVQVCGGMGFVEETGVAQYYRDSRILPIYEGTNGIQAIDLVTRKLQLENGHTLAQEIAVSEMAIRSFVGDNAAETVSSLRGMVSMMSNNSAEALAAAVPFQRALATTVAAGLLADAAKSTNATDATADAAYFATAELPAALAAAKGAISGASIVLGEFAST
jgi:acyl-CoA dehydrogenase